LQRRDADHSRTCIVTRRTASPDELIRFVVAPDGAVVADLRRRLPGRGVWVTATAETVRLAERRKLFTRAFAGPVTVEPGLAERVGSQLLAAATGALSLARKAGTVVAGFAKVEAALASQPVVALIHAAEAAPDGCLKLETAMRRRFGAGGLPVIRCFTGAHLDLAFGPSNVIHAALLVGPASGNVLARVDALIRYLGGNGDELVAARPLLAVDEVVARS
jgi:predicted RNA-binding protein YlxR (DUF448 family)